MAEIASEETWHGDGARDLATWLAARWQIARRTARELVRAAEALRSRPALAQALSTGAISSDQCKALSVLCDERTDDHEVWLENLPFWSFSELEREARKKVARDLERRDDGVYFRIRHTPDERYLRGEFQLHPEQGAAVLSAVEGLVPKDTPLRDWDKASATALVELAKGSDSPGRRPSVLVSVSAEALAGAPGAEDVAALGSGGMVGIETARRLSCDASIRLLYTDQDDRITAVGRSSRTVPPAMREVVTERDGGVCTFPECGMDAFLECHHIRHAAEGGVTVVENLQTVCWRHHELLHESKWSLLGPAGPDITWLRPDGAPFEPRVRVVLDTC